jgi:hypothetical protein
MFRKTLIAVAATAVIGVASLTPASAHHFGWGWGGVGFGLGLGMLGASIAAQNYVPVDNCLQYQMVPTRYGYYKRVLVNVCQ